MHFCDQFEGKKEEMDYDIEVLSAVWIYTLAQDLSHSDML